MYIANPSRSEVSIANELKMKRSTVGYIKREKLGMKSYTKIKTPKYTAGQELRAQFNCARLGRKLYRKKNLLIIMDDETYVPIDPSDIPGKDFYTATDKSSVDIVHKIAPKAKFRRSYLVWQAIDEHGNVSCPFVSDRTINSEVYLKECLKKRLLPFIEKYHRRKSVLLWMDMATCHYASTVISWLEEQGIEYVSKENNAPNVPQARPIEKFWALCKARYRKRKRPASSLSHFRNIWRGISKKIASESGLSLMENLRSKIREVGLKGVYSVIDDLN